MKKLSLLSVFLLLIVVLPKTSSAQYYYQDILTIRKGNQEFAAMKKSGIRSVTLHSFEEDDQPSDGFFAERKISKDYTQTEMISRSYITEETTIKTNYDAQGRIVKSITETPTTTNTTLYKYDAAGNLTEIASSLFDDRDSTTMTETRAYSYRNGLPEKMELRRNGTPAITIRFIADEHGNIIEENDGSNTVFRKFYYYYDSQHRLTDIVRYNAQAGRLLPDYMFEYDTKEPLPSRMTVVEEGGRNYVIWRYAYNAQALPEIEKCYTKEKRLLGTIEYEYK